VILKPASNTIIGVSVTDYVWKKSAHFQRRGQDVSTFGPLDPSSGDTCAIYNFGILEQARSEDVVTLNMPVWSEGIIRVYQGSSTWATILDVQGANSAEWTDGYSVLTVWCNVRNYSGILQQRLHVECFGRLCTNEMFQFV